MSRLSLCSESVNDQYPRLGQEYYDATGDDDGVEFQELGVLPFCCGIQHSLGRKALSQTVKHFPFNSNYDHKTSTIGPHQTGNL